MSDLKLSLACWDYDRTRPLADGRVKPDGIALDVQFLHPKVMFERMLREQAFDVSELSLSSYVTLLAKGNCPFVALPVALSKIFRHSSIYVRTDAGIRTPQDLKGKRVGLTHYGSTATVFMCGLLSDEYGVSLRDMHFLLGPLSAPGPRPHSPAHVPGGVKVDVVADGATLEGMLGAGELDALMSVFIPTLFRQGLPKIARLFADCKAVEQDYYRRTSIFPVMHTVVMRKDVLREHPWAAKSLTDAFYRAKDAALGNLYDTDALRVGLPWLLDHVEETWRVFGKDFWSYGLAPNRPALDAIGRYLHEQGLAPRVVTADEIFAPFPE